MLNFSVHVNKLRCDEKFCFNLELIFHDVSRHKLGRALLNLARMISFSYFMIGTNAKTC